MIRLNLREASQNRPMMGQWRPQLIDADDEFVLEVAIAAGCEYIITFNTRSFVEARLMGSAKPIKGRPHCTRLLYGASGRDGFASRIHQEDAENAGSRVEPGPQPEELMAGRVILMNQYTGSDFDDFLKEEGILEEVTAKAHKRLLALELEDAMAEMKLTKTELAKRLQTSRPQVDRLLDPDNTSVTLESLERLAQAVGKQLVVGLA